MNLMDRSIGGRHTYVPLIDSFIGMFWTRSIKGKKELQEKLEDKVRKPDKTLTRVGGKLMLNLP
jgi:hypothetical protein